MFLSGTHEAFCAAFSVITSSAEVLLRRQREGAQPTTLSQAIMQSQLPLEAINILLLTVVYPGQRRQTGSTTSQPPGPGGMHSRPPKQHLAGHLTECGPQHGSVSMEEWQALEAPELCWSAAHRHLLRALGISPKGLAYVAAFPLCDFYSASLTRVLVQSYQVFAQPGVHVAICDLVTEHGLSLSAGNHQQQQPQGILADSLEVHFCLPSVMMHWAAHQVPTCGAGLDRFTNCCTQAAFSTNLVLQLACRLCMQTSPKAADDVSGPTPAAQASKEAERKDAAGPSAAAPAEPTPSLAPTQLAEIIKLTGQLSQGLLSHMQAAASANTSAAGSSSSSSSSTRARRDAAPTTSSTSSRQAALTTRAAGLPSDEDIAKLALEHLLITVILLRETCSAGSEFVLQASSSTHCSSSQGSTSQGRSADTGSAAVTDAWCQHAPQLMALAEACMRVDKSPQYRLFRMEQCGVMYKPGTDILMDAALQAAADSPQQQQLLLGMLTSMLKVALHIWKPGYCTAQGVASGTPPAEAGACMVYVSSVVAHIVEAAATGCAASADTKAAAAAACRAGSDISQTSSPSQRDQCSAGSSSSSSKSSASSSSVNSTTISGSSEPSSSAAHLLPCLMLWGRCLLACAAQLRLIAAALQAAGETEENKDMCLQISSTMLMLIGIVQPSLKVLLANSSLSAGFTAAGGCDLLPALQRLASIDISPTMMAACDNKPGPSDSNAAVILKMVQELQSAGLALNAPASRTICNNPRCPVTTGLSERQLVGGHSCCCSACRTARYCCKACQTMAWKLHKPVRKAITATAAASAASAASASAAAEGGMEQADVA